ncbi:hypothetical protein Tco_0116815 [Tanacetum coccineum]
MITCTTSWSACTSEIVEDFDSLSFHHVGSIRRTSLIGFPAQSIRSSNAIALDSPYLLILITGASQSRQHEAGGRYNSFSISSISKGDGGKTVGGAIGARGSGIGEMASEAKRSLDKSSEGSEEVFPSEARE